MLGIPAALLTVALLVRDPIERALGWTPALGSPIVYAYSRMFPRWLLNGVFLALTLLALTLLAGGTVRLWRAARRSRAAEKVPARSLIGSIASVAGSVILHDRFRKCTESRSRYWSHLAVFFGFLALSIVTLWVISAPYNPLVRGTFVYPFGFWNPWKILANLGGIALAGGCLLMVRDRIRERAETSLSTFPDWVLIGTLLVVVLTGFATEVLHYVRLEPHRHLVYFAHLVFVGALFLYLPYSKLAHVVYRTTALVGAEYYGRSQARAAPPGGPLADPAGTNHT
jgi:quinone-modifying oxidoreductase subunit QmoC